MVLSKPELLALMLYVRGASGKIGEEVKGRTRLMKLVFILSKETEGKTAIVDSQSFRPYRFGPFDAEVFDAIDALKELKLMEEYPPRNERVLDEEGEAYDADTIYRLTDAGMKRAEALAKIVPPDFIRQISKVKTVFGSKPLVELLHYVYQRYPEFAKLSEAKL